MKKILKNKYFFYYMSIGLCLAFIFCISKLTNQQITAMNTSIQKSNSQIDSITNNFIESKDNLVFVEQYTTDNHINNLPNDNVIGVKLNKQFTILVTKKYIAKNYVGQLENLVAKKTSGCHMKLSKNKNGTYQLEGTTDNVNLFGKWDLVGNKIGSTNRYEFVGEIEFDSDRSGFEKGTKAPFKITAEITEDYFKGKYEIGVFHDIKYVQFGIIDLH